MEKKGAGPSLVEDIAKAVRARGGQFSAAFRPGRQGTWRFYVATIADRFHGRGESRRYQLRVGR